MAEEIDFKFSGALSDHHALDFYEAGRLQYGASRLMVKLDQFRRTGRFSSRITYDNNTRILLRTQEDGSFVIGAVAPALSAAGEAFIQASISLMSAYVADRVLKRATNDDLTSALEPQQELLRSFDANIAGRDEHQRRTLDLLEERIRRGDDGCFTSASSLRLAP